MLRTSSWPLLGGLLASAAFIAPPAFAQQADGVTLEPIVVTARKFEENLQDAPVAVSAFTAAALERQQIGGTVDLGRVTPNLQFTSYGPLSGNNSAAQVFIRGIGQTDPTGAVDPGVGLYIDDVYMGRAVGGAMDFRDIAGVQVLRGPQGTLFGRNTIGGAVLMTSTMPGHRLGGELRAKTGDDKLIAVFGAIDVPLGEQLATRFSAGLRKRDGYVTRVFDGKDLGDDNTYTMQGVAVWTPRDSFTATLRADYTNEDENGSPFVFRTINTSAAFVAAGSVGAGCPGATFPPPRVPEIKDTRCANNTTWSLGPYTNGGSAPAVSTLKNYGASAVLEWEASDALTFKSITARREITWTGVRDADNTPINILTTDYDSTSKQFSQEVQALYKSDRLKGVLGLFYFKEKTND
ncbi:MAG: TonB-dependent receptor plug domain-containing protein, partial [Phenylobacterium sp.]